MKVLALRGISGSGKSTYAQTLKQQGWAVVSRDAIRESVFKDYASVDEDAVTVIQDASVDALLRAGRNVVIDDTNIRTKYLKRFAELAAKHNADFDIKQFDCDIVTAMDRIHYRADEGGRFVPEAVVRKQAQGIKNRVNLEELHTPTWQPYEPELGSPKAILVDIDGTLAHNDGHRDFYDYTRVYDDAVIHAVADLVRRYFEDHVIVIMSGRDDSCQQSTIDWLVDNGIPFDEIHMRKTGDQRKDSIVKIELFDEFVRDTYDVQFVLDDRQQVVDAWRSIGLRVFQVAPGDF